MENNVWFTSDLHLGHEAIAKHRGFTNVVEHDWAIIAQLQAMVRKREKLFILGDVVWNDASLKLLSEIPGTKELIIGNHDNLQTKKYLRYFTKVHGFRKYKNFWLSHCPIHPQEMYRATGNIHGHIHMGACYRGAGDEYKDIAEGKKDNSLGYPYFNVNIDMNGMAPVNLDTINHFFKTEGMKNETT